MEDDFGLQGRKALVIGGSRNIGRAIALKIANAGAAVAITWQSDQTGASQTVEEILGAGGSAAPIKMMLQDPTSIERGIDEAVALIGSPDIVICSAAIRPKRSIASITADEWDHVFDVNVRGPFLVVQRVWGAMIKEEWGRVIFLGGLAAYLGLADRPHVIAGKMALVGLARALALEGGDKGITANVIVPGEIDTVRSDSGDYGHSLAFDKRCASIPVGRLGRPEEVADACLFLASDRSSYITGQELFVSGGAHPLVRR